MSAAEFDLISRIRARIRERDDVLLGIGDDAALLQMPPGMQLVVTADTLNAGVHFPEATAPAASADPGQAAAPATPPAPPEGSDGPQRP